MIELPQNLDLDNREFRQVLELVMNTNRSVFMTGKAGTGKSTFLRYICEHTLKRHVVLAPTGVAALNAGGVTIHSFFRMPFRPVPPDDPEYSLFNMVKHLKLRRETIKLIKELDLIIIDEVSMVRCDMIDFIDRALRAITGNRRAPFGGKQLLLVGDIFQLEPVVTSDTREILSKYYPDFFFFNARAYSDIALISVELRKVYRQTDDRFVKLLDRVRVSAASENDLAQLNARVEEDAAEKVSRSGNDDFSIILASRRDIVDSFNDMKMDALDSEPFIFYGDIQDDFPEKILPTDIALTLKVGAQVMLVKNDRDKRWVNGTLARIDGIEGDFIRVTLETGETYTVAREVWENVRYYYDEKEKRVREEIIGSFTQFPLKPAWAMTIHKSQGLTFNRVVIDLGGGGAFSAGQTYVALSRCRSLEGLSFVSPVRKSDIIVSREAANFSRKFNDELAIERSLREAKAAECVEASLRHFDNGAWRDAVEYMFRAADFKPDGDHESLKRLLSVRLARTDALKAELERKEAMLRHVADEYVELGNMSLEYPEGMAAALANFTKATELNAANAGAWIGKMKGEIGLKKFKEAEKSFLRAMKLKLKNGQRIDLYILKGELCEKTSDYAGALVNYKAAQKLDKRNSALKIKIDSLESRYDSEFDDGDDIDF